MQWARAAERDEREAGGIVSALDGDDAQRAQHLGVHDVDYCGGVDPVQRTFGGGPVELHAAREALRQTAEQEVRVRDRRLRPTPAVTGGARVRPCALRADAQRTAGVAPDE